MVEKNKYMSNYKNTLFIPNSSFPMKANLNELEPKMQKFWNDISLYENVSDEIGNENVITLHDGPPYANGNIHIGHALNKILKDFIIRWYVIKGYKINFRPGWDCHGMPIELAAIRSTKTGEGVQPRCREYAEKVVEKQSEDFQKLGILADWKHPYKTMDFDYQSTILEVLEKLHDKKLLSHCYRPVNWCVETETVIADSEVEYIEVEDNSVYVSFNLITENSIITKPAKFVIWTTTPWSLPGNMAIAVNPEFNYVVTKNGYIVAETLLDEFNKHCNLSEVPHKIVSGYALKGLVAEHPFIKKISQIIYFDDVSSTSGTGLVHMAPGHGLEDFNACMPYGIETYCPVNEKGFYDSTIPELEGISVTNSYDRIKYLLNETGSLLGERKYKHQYPFNSRVGCRLITRTVNQLVLDLDNVGVFGGPERTKLQDAIDQTHWFPSKSKNRISNMVRNRQQWILSRQRKWGVPIPSVECENCGDISLTKDMIQEMAKTVNAFGTYIASRTLKFIKCPNCESTNVKFASNILDVWFDSGISHEYVNPNIKKYEDKIDFYVEGNDQHRGWFQSSLITSVALNEMSPYKYVLTHGMVLDGEGKKMSKSAGNVVTPEEVIKKYGADVLRLWVCSENVFNDLRINDEILNNVVDTYRKIRNTLRFGLGMISGYEPMERDLRYLLVESSIEGYILHLFENYKKDIFNAYSKFEYHKIYQLTVNFIVNDLSNFFFEIAKEKVYISSKSDPSSSCIKHAIYQITRDLTHILSPILPHTMEETWGYLPNTEGSVFTYKLNTEIDNYAVSSSKHTKCFSRLRSIRNDVFAKFEKVKDSLNVTKMSQVNLKLFLEETLYDNIYESMIDTKSFFMVSNIELISSSFNKIELEKSNGNKCNRCWKYHETVGMFRLDDVCISCYEILQKDYPELVPEM